MYIQGQGYSLYNNTYDMAIFRPWLYYTLTYNSEMPGHGPSISDNTIFMVNGHGY